MIRERELELVRPASHAGTARSGRARWSWSVVLESLAVVVIVVVVVLRLG